MEIKKIAEICKQFGCMCRLKSKWDDEPSEWDKRVIEPVPNYIELPVYGPVSAVDVEWLEIDPCEIRHRGRLVKDETIDHTDEIIAKLKLLGAEATIHAGLIRIKHRTMA